MPAGAALPAPDPPFAAALVPGFVAFFLEVPVVLPAGAPFLAAGDFFAADGAAFFAAVTMISFNVCPASGHIPQHTAIQEHSRHLTGG